MCDYSQHGLPSRLACEGELLITYRFPTQLIGLASALDLDEAERQKRRVRRSRTWMSAIKRWCTRDVEAGRIPAIFIPPGARLRMTHIPAALRTRWALRPVEDVWFTQTGDDPEQFRDAIRFGNGRLLVLQTLPESICFMVLSLGSDQWYTERLTFAGPNDFRLVDTLPAW